jgi:hypothetical protein
MQIYEALARYQRRQVPPFPQEPVDIQTARALRPLWLVQNVGA